MLFVKSISRLFLGSFVLAACAAAPAVAGSESADYVGEYKSGSGNELSITKKSGASYTVSFCAYWSKGTEQEHVGEAEESSNSKTILLFSTIPIAQIARLFCKLSCRLSMLKFATSPKVWRQLRLAKNGATWMHQAAK